MHYFGHVRCLSADVKENQYTPISEGTKDRGMLMIVSTNVVSCLFLTVSPYEKLNYDS